MDKLAYLVVTWIKLTPLELSILALNRLWWEEIVCQSFHDCTVVIRSFISSLSEFLLGDVERFSSEEVTCNRVHLRPYIEAPHLADIG